MTKKKILVMHDSFPPVLLHNSSRLRQNAKKVGIVVERPDPHPPLTEQEQADTM